MRRGIEGSTAVAFKFKGGVISATDNSATYGYTVVNNITKIFKLTDSCVMTCSGLYSDILYVKNFIAQELNSDPRPIDAKGIHKLLQRLMYAKRSRVEPLSVHVVVSGLHKKEGFIGCINPKGNFWMDDCVATGIASHLIIPLLREKDLLSLSKEEAISFMEHCMKILFYKDCRASNVVQIAVVEDNKAEVMEPHAISSDWLVGLREDETILE